jgi:uncharacterized coiled-coil protein SlyX
VGPKKPLAPAACSCYILTSEGWLICLITSYADAMADLDKRVTDLEQFYRDIPELVNLRLSTLEGRLEPRLATLEKQQAMLTQDMRALRNDMVGLRREMYEMKAELKGEIGELRDEVRALRAGVTAIMQHLKIIP